VSKDRHGLRLSVSQGQLRLNTVQCSGDWARERKVEGLGRMYSPHPDGAQPGGRRPAGQLDGEGGRG